MKQFKKIAINVICTLTVLLMLWMVVSFADVYFHNGLGESHKYFKGNFWVLITPDN